MAAAAPAVPPTKPRRQRFIFELPEHLRAWLDAQSQERGVSRSDVLRDLVSRARRADLRKSTDDEPALTLAGR